MGLVPPPGRAAARTKLRETKPGIDTVVDLEDDDQLDFPPSDLSLGAAVLDWREVGLWHEVAAEWSIWDDPRHLLASTGGQLVCPYRCYDIMRGKGP